MALQSTGPLAFSEIVSEFGIPKNKNLGGYRINESYGRFKNISLDAGIPKSGIIKFSDFYNKRLNIIVNFWSGGTEYRQNARSRYNSNVVNVVGGLKSRPINSSGTKVFIHIDKTIGSEVNGNRSVTAFRTGSWDSGTILSVDIGPNSRILGAGGGGGKGANNTGENGHNGGNGNSALGLEYNGVTVNVSSGAIISCGFGGGGGGGASINTFGGGGGKKGGGGGASVTASGGGGGGGAGFPSGPGGAGGSGANSGTGGSSGSTFSRGGGGSGGSGRVCQTSGKGKNATTTCITATGGSGGNGGDGSNNPLSGQTVNSSGGSNGSNGASIRTTVSYTLNNSGNIIGGIENGSVN